MATRIVLELDELAAAALVAAAIRHTDPTPGRRKRSRATIGRACRELAPRFLADGLRANGYRLPDDRP